MRRRKISDRFIFSKDEEENSESIRRSKQLIDEGLKSFWNRR